MSYYCLQTGIMNFLLKICLQNYDCKKKNIKNMSKVTMLKWYDHYALSPRILLANWMSLGIIVTLFAWIAHKLVSSNKPTRYASLASYNDIKIKIR